MSAFIWLIFFFFVVANCVMRKRVCLKQLLKTNTQQMMNETKLHFLVAKTEEKEEKKLFRKEKPKPIVSKKPAHSNSSNKLIMSNILVI